METGISFDGLHSNLDWGLRLKNAHIDSPVAKTEYLDIPGMNGSLDLTEAQTGKIKYDDRKGEFLFHARNCSWEEWEALCSRIAKYLAGKKMKIKLDWEPGYIYIGRCQLANNRATDVTGDIKITCVLEPYKMYASLLDAYGNWKQKEVQVNAPSTWQLCSIQGYEFNKPLIINTVSTLKVKMNEEILLINPGETVLYDFEIQEGYNYLYFQGQGTVYITQRGGKL